VFYVFHGGNQHDLQERLAGLRRQMAGGDASMADLNTNVLEGSRLTLAELRHVCDAIPFLADRRLVIVHGLLTRLAPAERSQEEDAPQTEDKEWKRRALQELADYLPQLAPTTRLIFVERETLRPNHPILQVAKEQGKVKKGFIEHFELPGERALPGWIQQRARSTGQGQISSEAAALMAVLVGPDLRLLDIEIEKLLLYAGGRMVTTEDVQLLVSRARETKIFDLVDCVGRRQTGPALRVLHRLLDEGEPPLKLLAMLARQIRILIQLREMGEQGADHREVARQLKLHPYVVQKGSVQARNFELDQLEEAHERVVQTDWAIKSGRSDAVLALDMLVVALTRA
jgi:DNA polymerase III subunit delta